MIFKKNFCSIFLFGMVCCIRARPQLRKPDHTLFEAQEQSNGSVYADDSSLAFLKQENKTKTRILARGTPHIGEYLGYSTEQDIVFPDSVQVIFENIPRIEGPPKCAQESTFCEDFESYPYDRVSEVLKRKHVHNDLFGVDEPPEDLKYNISNRFGEIEEFVCSSFQKTIFPKVGINKNNKWKYIINQNDSQNYIQGITVEICRQEGRRCDIVGEIPNGYITSCKQKFISRRLMSLSENGDPIPDTFKMPSACCCSYKKDIEFLRRFGFEQSERKQW